MTDTTTLPATNSTTDRLPFFVYGTLRPTSGNDRLWAGRADFTDDGTCCVEGYRLVTCGFPYAIPAAGDVIVGTLVWPHSESYDEVRRDLDRLEGVPGHYSRIAVNVVFDEDVAELAWLYTPTRPEAVADLPPVEGNDWRNEERTRR